MFATIIKRDGRAVAYDRSKIEVAIEKAMEAGGRKNAAGTAGAGAMFLSPGKNSHTR